MAETRSDLSPGMPQGTTPIRNPGQGGFRLVPWASGMEKGAGYDSVTQTVRARAAERPANRMTHSAVLGSVGQYVQRKVLQIESIEKMREILQLGAELDVGYDAFSANSVGKFLRETRVDSYNLYFLVICYVQTTEFRIDEFGLAERFQTAWMPSDAEFREGFGDYFVTGWIKGGYLIGLAEIRATSQQALNRVKTETGAGYSDAALSVKSRFASDWEKWSSQTDLQSRLEVIYAGLDGRSLKTVVSTIGPTPSPTPRKPPDPTPRPPARPRSLAANEVSIVDDTTDPDDDPPEFLSRANGARTPAGGHRAPPDRDPEFEHLDPSTNDPTLVDRNKVEMTMQGLLDAADALPAQVLTHGVPLYAILEAYSPLYRKTGDTSIDGEEFERKRDLVNHAYLKARFVHNSVSYAIEHGAQFGTPPAVLQALKDRMDTLMSECVRASARLRTNPAFVLPKTIAVPSDSEIPRWTVQKTEFHPLKKLPDPAQFTRLLATAAETVKASAGPVTAAGRKALTDYLSSVLEGVVENYIRASDVLTAIAVTLPAVDLEPQERTANLQDLAETCKDAADAWTASSTAIAAAFGELEGKGGLDAKALEFLKHLNPVLFGPDRTPDKQIYGFAAFWTALSKGLAELAQQSRIWDPAARFDDLVSYGKATRWSDPAAAFKLQVQAIDARVRSML